MGAGVGSQRNPREMRSQVAWALLGLIIQRPSYGYELDQRFRRTYAGTLELSSQSQIYKSLDALVDHGLVERIDPDDLGPAGDRQPRPHYQATDLGLGEHEQWVISLAREQRRGFHLLTRQVSILEPEQALSVLGKWEMLYLEEARSATPSPPADPSPANHSPASSPLTARLQREEHKLLVGAALAWIDYARHELKATIKSARAKQ